MSFGFLMVFFAALRRIEAVFPWVQSSCRADTLPSLHLISKFLHVLLGCLFSTLHLTLLLFFSFLHSALFCDARRVSILSAFIFWLLGEAVVGKGLLCSSLLHLKCPTSCVWSDCLYRDKIFRWFCCLPLVHIVWSRANVDLLLPSGF